MTAQRLVRIFISSTFRDFLAERDELVKKVFPELRRRCRNRFVEIVEIDLRWGITPEQAEGGEVLPICLAEITRCRPGQDEQERPYFIGLLGQRYGWVPGPGDKSYSDELLLAMPWLKEHMGGKSVTELEILHVVLRNEAMNGRVFFYFRDPDYIEQNWSQISRQSPPPTRADFIDADPGAAQALEALKHQIRARGADYVIRESYRDPETAGNRILEDLWTAIDASFPASEVPDTFTRETLEHQVFRDSRAKAYVERDGLFEQLDAHARREGDPVRVVLGASGSGKSALLAAWLARHEEKVVFYHFIGGTPASSTAETVVRRLLETIRRRGAVSRESQIPQTLKEMVTLLPPWLEKLGAAGGGVLLIDALNQLTDSADRELKWFPKELPENVRVVFSTLPGDSLRALQDLGWAGDENVVTVPPLQPEEKGQIMRHYLKLFTKELAAVHQDRILAAPLTSNPLFLRTLLEELRLRSRHEDLDNNLTQMLECPDPASLFVYILKGLERDFTPNTHPELVHRALGLMGTARRGLTESEILQLLSSAETPANEPLPRHLWSPLFLALEDSLVSRDGQLGWFHDYLRQAVLREYLDEKHEQDSAHRRLADSVTCWAEPRFSPSLLRYGFEHGIGHLLAVDDLDEAKKLGLNRSYREAATYALRAPAALLADVERVRLELAKKQPRQFAEGAELAAIAIREPVDLVRYLRAELDARAREGDWAEASELAGAGGTPAEQVLLAFRALSRGKGAAGGEFTEKLTRWMGETAKEEWAELFGRMRAHSQAKNTSSELGEGN